MSIVLGLDVLVDYAELVLQSLVGELDEDFDILDQSTMGKRDDEIIAGDKVLNDDKIGLDTLVTIITNLHEIRKPKTIGE